MNYMAPLPELELKMLGRMAPLPELELQMLGMSKYVSVNNIERIDGRSVKC